MSIAQVCARFKFKWINDKGKESGFLRKKGSFDGTTLLLDKSEIVAEAIISFEIRGNRVILSANTGGVHPQILAFAIVGLSAKRLKGLVDISRSASWAKLERLDLEKRGEAHLYRQVSCQHCNAVITLSRMEDTPQLYCSFCDTLTTVRNPHSSPADEKSLKICDECGLFSKPKKFTIFYFYFAFFIYGFRHSSTWRCPGCMRGEAWKMFFGNLIFLLGVPVAITQLVRCYSGSVTGKFAGIDSANIKSTKGKSAKALTQYQDILKRVPHSAGVKYNIGLGLLNQKPELAADSFEMALRDCSNYAPAANALADCYVQLNATEKLAQLKYIWDDEESEPIAEGPLPLNFS